MKRLLILTLLFIAISCGDNNSTPNNSNIPKQNPSDGLTITSMNIKWYGVGGKLDGKPEDEKRDFQLKKFFSKHLDKTDVFVFQEIIDVDRLINLFPAFNCQSYNKRNPRHQHIVVCVKKTLRAKFEVLYSMDLDNAGLRPAVMAEINLGDDQIVRVYGVHLKAREDESDVRIDQIKAFAQNTNFDEPAVVIGDFNTYTTLRNGKSFDDDQMIEEILDDYEFDQVGDGVDSYVGRFPFRKFDRAWTRKLEVTPLSVFGPCKKDFPLPFGHKGFYRNKISDHCPISLTIKNILD